MVPRKRITDGATSKGKAKATIGGMTSKPTNNQPRIEDTDSISPHESSTSRQPSQPQEDQLFQMLYGMKE